MGDPESVGKQANSLPDVSQDTELTYTADQVVEKFLALRNTVKAIKAKHAVELEPYTAAMTALESYAAVMMTKLNTTLSTPHGSAFWVRAWTYRCVDFEKFFPWVVKNKQQQMMTRHVSQDALADWIEVEKSKSADKNLEIKLPPGIESDYRITVQFRKG